MPASVLGSDHGKPVEISLADRREGLYVIGKNGTGKSTLLLNLIVQDMQQDTGFCLLDPHGDLAERVLERVPVGKEDRVILLDVSDSAFPFGLNLYTTTDITDPNLADRRGDQVLQVFRKLWEPERWGPLVEEYLQACGITLLEHPGYTMLEIPLLLSCDPEDAWFRERLTADLKNPVARDFWKRWKSKPLRDRIEESGAAMRRVDSFRASATVRHIVGQHDTTVDLRAAMDGGYFVVIKLAAGSVGDAVVTLLGGVLVGQILTAALGRIDTPERERRQFHFYCDEYERFSTEDLAAMLTQVRKFGVGTTVAHQFRGQLDKINAGAVLQAGSKVVFGVSGMDGEELAHEFDRTPPEPLVIGQRSKLAILGNPTEHLIRRGSDDPSLVRAINRTLQSLYIAAQPMEKESELRVLDQHYYALMTGHVVPRSAQDIAFWSSFLRHKFSTHISMGEPDLFPEYGWLTRFFRDLCPYFRRYGPFHPELVRFPMIYRSYPLKALKPEETSPTRERAKELLKVVHEASDNVTKRIPEIIILVVEGKRQTAQRELIKEQSAVYLICLEQPRVDLQIAIEAIPSQIAILDERLLNPIYIKEDRLIKWESGGGPSLAAAVLDSENYQRKWDQSNPSRVVMRAFREINNYLVGSLENSSPVQQQEYRALAEKGICRELLRRAQAHLEWLETEGGRQAQQIVEPPITAYLDRAQDLIEIGHILARNPIYTESGQYEPIFDRPRPYADVQAEISSKLTNQPDLQAKCKLPSGEPTITVRWNTHPVTQTPAMVEAIREWSRLQYGRPRAHVEAAITRRQTPPAMQPRTPAPEPPPKLPPRNRRPGQ